MTTMADPDVVRERLRSVMGRITRASCNAVDISFTRFVRCVVQIT